jgi:hypothetical protein
MAFSLMRSMRNDKVSMPCRIKKELKGEMAAPVFRSGTTLRPADVGRGPQRLGVNHAVIADVGLVQAPKPILVLGPGKFSGIDDGAADAGAVSTQILGQRMHHDVRAMLKRAA